MLRSEFCRLVNGLALPPLLFGAGEFKLSSSAFAQMQKPVERSLARRADRHTQRIRGVQMPFLRHSRAATRLAWSGVFRGFSLPQSNARMPKPVSLGRPSRSSTNPKFTSAVRSSALTGENFVRLLLISRITHRR